MSSEDVIVNVSNISKCYEMYDKPAHRLFQTLCVGKKKFYKEFWALRDIDFKVKRGECIGIIGRNGAGKSTLLQIITGTLSPTTGTVEIKGRVAALLELGSGFNPEFTGRDNVYMNAAILGFTKAETDAKYQEIVDFADIGEFIDQPVKTYSSGMMVRLAFAVQVMVDPDLLIVDEALAVGDAFFQKKCMQKLEEIKSKGVTLIFVSHDVFSIRRLCVKALLLERGRVHAFGDSSPVTSEYYKLLFPPSDAFLDIVKTDPACENKSQKCVKKDNVMEYVPQSPASWGKGGIRLERFLLHTPSAPESFQDGDRLVFEMEYSCDPEILRAKATECQVMYNLIFGIRIDTAQSVVICDLAEMNVNHKEEEIHKKIKIKIEAIMPALMRGNYFLTPGVALGSPQNLIPLASYDNLVLIRSDTRKNFIGLLDIPNTITRG